MGYFAPHDAETTLACPHCGSKLHITRSCLEVTMRCPVCGKVYPVKDFIDRADKVMEEFIGNVYCDRI